MPSQKSACRDATQALHVLCCALTLYIYLLDLSMLRMIIRHAAHMQVAWHTTQPDRRIAAIIVGSNLVLFLWHLVSTLPTPGPYQDGFLHGGFLIDFVGQEPGSKMRMLLLDCLYLLAQVALVDVQTLQHSTQSVEGEEEGLLEEHEARLVFKLGSGLQTAWHVQEQEEPSPSIVEVPQETSRSRSASDGSRVEVDSPSRPPS